MPPPREAPAQTLSPTIFGQHVLLSAAVFAPRLRLAMLPTTTTARFQLALPSLLASIAPSLSALHATRAHSLYPEDATLAGTHCVRCGYPLIPSNSHTRSVRKKRKSGHGQSTIVRALRRSCRNCGHDEDVPIAVAHAFMAFPRPRDRTKRQSSNIIQPRACIAATPPPKADSLVPGPSQPRSLQPVVFPVPSGPRSSAPARVAQNTLATRHSSAGSSSLAQQDHTRARSLPKKKTGLQSMLVRNRERQEQEKKREGNHNHGLSAFLQGL